MTNSIHPVYLLLGPEQGTKSDFIKDLSAQLTKRIGSTPEIHKYYPFETSINHIISVIRNGTLFSDHIIAILSNVESIKRKEDLTLLSDYCRNPADNVTLLLLSDAVRIDIDKKIGKSLDSSAKKIFWELFYNQKENWIRRFFSQKSISISAEAVELLLELVENNTAEMKQECDKLALFFNTGHEITVTDIETYIYHSKEENIFTLFDALADRDLSHSLEILQKILLSGESQGVGILAGLLYQYRKLLKLLSMVKDHQYKPEEAFPKLQIRGKRSQKTYLKGLKNYTRDNLEDILVTIGEYDTYVKEYQSQARELLLSLFIYYCICDSCSISTPR
jgi:DNA polymerase-3 subunit delta